MVVVMFSFLRKAMSWLTSFFELKISSHVCLIVVLYRYLEVILHFYAQYREKNVFNLFMSNIFPNAFHLPHRRFTADTRKSHAETLLVQRGYQQAHRCVKSVIDLHEKCVLHNIGIPCASPWSRFYRRCTYRIIPSTYKNYRISSASSVGLLEN